MLTKDFVKHLLGHGKQLAEGPYREIFPEAAACSSFFKFPCNFNPKTKKCKADRATEACCCSGCFHSIGYLGKTWPNNWQLLKYYAKYFDYEVGFWREGRGCVLPRHMRSLTCSYYVCVMLYEEFNKINSPAVIELRNAGNRYLGEFYGQYRNKALRDFNKAIVKFGIDHMISWNNYTKRFEKLIKIEKRPEGTFIRTRKRTIFIGHILKEID